MKEAKEIVWWTLFIVAACLLAVSTAGCTATNTLAQGMSAKSISGSGTVIYSTVGLDPATQTPELKNLFVWGDYTSVANGDEIFRLEDTEDASIFNAEAVTKKRKIFFASSDKKRMDKVIDKVIAADKKEDTPAMDKQ